VGIVHVLGGVVDVERLRSVRFKRVTRSGPSDRSSISRHSLIEKNESGDHEEPRQLLGQGLRRRRRRRTHTVNRASKDSEMGDVERSDELKDFLDTQRGDC